MSLVGGGLCYFFAKNSRTIIRTKLLTVVPFSAASFFNSLKASGEKNTLMRYEFDFSRGDMVHFLVVYVLYHLFIIIPIHNYAQKYQL